MKKNSEGRTFGWYLKTLAIATLVAIVLCILAEIPPFSMLYDWLVAKNLKIVWYGLNAGSIALVLVIYNNSRCK